MSSGSSGNGNPLNGENPRRATENPFSSVMRGIASTKQVNTNLNGDGEGEGRRTYFGTLRNDSSPLPSSSGGEEKIVHTINPLQTKVGSSSSFAVGELGKESGNSPAFETYNPFHSSGRSSFMHDGRTTTTPGHSGIGDEEKNKNSAVGRPASSVKAARFQLPSRGFRESWSKDKQPGPLSASGGSGGGGPFSDHRVSSPNPLTGTVNGGKRSSGAVAFGGTTSGGLPTIHSSGRRSSHVDVASMDSAFEDLSSDEDREMGGGAAAMVRSKEDDVENSGGGGLDASVGGAGMTLYGQRRRSQVRTRLGGEENTGGTLGSSAAGGRPFQGFNDGKTRGGGGMMGGNTFGQTKGKNPFSGKPGGMEMSTLTDPSPGTSSLSLNPFTKGMRGNRWGAGGGSESMGGGGTGSDCATHTQGFSTLFPNRQGEQTQWTPSCEGGQGTDARGTPSDLSPEERQEYERLRAFSLFIPTTKHYHNGEGLDRPGVLHAEEGWKNRHYTKLVHEGYMLFIDWKVLFMIILLFCIGVSAAGLGKSVSELMTNKSLLQVEELAMYSAEAMIKSIYACGTSTYKTPGVAVAEPDIVSHLRELVKKVNWEAEMMNSLLDGAKEDLASQSCFDAADKYNELFEMAYERQSILSPKEPVEMTSYARAWALGWTQWRAEGMLVKTEDPPITSKRAITSVAYNLMCLKPLQTVNLANAFEGTYECTSDYQAIIDAAPVTSINYEMALHTMFDFISNLNTIDDIPDLSAQDSFHVISFSIVIVLCILALVYLFQVPFSYRQADKEKKIMHKDFVVYSSLVEMKRTTLRLLDYYIWRMGAFEPIYLKEACCMGYEITEEEWNRRVQNGGTGAVASAANAGRSGGGGTGDAPASSGTEDGGEDGSDSKEAGGGGEGISASSFQGRRRESGVMEVIVLDDEGAIGEKKSKNKNKDTANLFITSPGKNKLAGIGSGSFKKSQISSSLSISSDKDAAAAEQLLHQEKTKSKGEDAAELALQDSFVLWRELAEHDDLHSFKGKSLPKQAMERAHRLAMLVDSSTTDRLDGGTQIQVVLHKVAAILLLLRPFIPRHLLCPVSHAEWSSMRHLGPSIPFRRSHITLQEGLRSDVSVYLFVSFYPFHRPEAVESARRFHLAKRALEKQKFMEEERKRQEEKCWLFREDNLEKLYAAKRHSHHKLLTEEAEQEASLRQAERRAMLADKNRNRRALNGESGGGGDLMSGGRQDTGLAGMMATTGGGADGGSGDGWEEDADGREGEEGDGMQRGTGGHSSSSTAEMVRVLSSNDAELDGGRGEKGRAGGHHYRGRNGSKKGKKKKRRGGGGGQGRSATHLEMKPLLMDGGRSVSAYSSSAALPSHRTRRRGNGGGEGGGGYFGRYGEAGRRERKDRDGRGGNYYRNPEEEDEDGDAEEEDDDDDEDDDGDGEGAVGGRLTDTQYVVETVLQRKAILRTLKDRRRRRDTNGRGPASMMVPNVLAASPPASAAAAGLERENAGTPTGIRALLPPPTSFHPSGPEYAAYSSGAGAARHHYHGKEREGDGSDPLRIGNHQQSKKKGSKRATDVKVGSAALPLSPSSSVATSTAAPYASGRGGEKGDGGGGGGGGAAHGWEDPHAAAELKHVKQYPLSSMAAGVNYVVESIFRVASVYHGDVVQICGDGVLIKFSVDDDEYTNVLGAKHTREDVTEFHGMSSRNGEGENGRWRRSSNGISSGTGDGLWGKSNEHGNRMRGGGAAAPFATSGGVGSPKHPVSRGQKPGSLGGRRRSGRPNFDNNSSMMMNMGTQNSAGGYHSEMGGDPMWREVIINGVSYQLSAAERAVRSAKTLQEMMLIYLDYSEDMFISPEFLQCPMAIVDEEYSLKGRLRYHVSKHYAVLSRCIPLFFALERINIEYGAEIVMTQNVKNQVEGFVLSRPVHYMQVSDLNYHYIKETTANHDRNDSSQCSHHSSRRGSTTSSFASSGIRSPRGGGDGRSFTRTTERLATDDGAPLPAGRRGSPTVLNTTSYSSFGGGEANTTTSLSTGSGGMAYPGSSSSSGGGTENSGASPASPHRPADRSRRDGQNPEDYPRFSAQGTIYALFNVCPLSDDDAFTAAYNMEESQNRVRREHWRLIWDKYIHIVDMEPQINFLRKFVHSSLSHSSQQSEGLIDVETVGSSSEEGGGGGSAMGSTQGGKYGKTQGGGGTGKYGNTFGGGLNPFAISSSSVGERSGPHASRFNGGRTMGGGGGEDGGKGGFSAFSDTPFEMAGSGTLGGYLAGSAGGTSSHSGKLELRGQSVSASIMAMRDRVHDLMRELDTYNHIYEFSSREGYSCQKLWKYGHDMLMALGMSEEDFDNAYGQ